MLQDNQEFSLLDLHLIHQDFTQVMIEFWYMTQQFIIMYTCMIFAGVTFNLIHESRITWISLTILIRPDLNCILSKVYAIQYKVFSPPPSLEEKKHLSCFWAKKTEIKYCVHTYICTWCVGQINQNIGCSGSNGFIVQGLTSNGSCSPT